MIFLCFKIFFTRIIDVSLGTFRTIMTVKGRNFLAGLIGFFEVFIWFVIVQEALSIPTTNILIAIFYSLGFATGTIIGGYIATYLIKTPISLQIITTNNKMADFLYDNGFEVSQIKSYGKNGIRDLLILETTDKHYKKIMSLIRIADEKAFIAVDEIKYVHDGFNLRK